jgi:hypothetical protein
MNATAAARDLTVGSLGTLLGVLLLMLREVLLLEPMPGVLLLMLRELERRRDFP